MLRRTLALLLLAACSSPPTKSGSAVVPDDPTVPKAAPRGPLLSPAAQPTVEVRGLVGPHGTFGVETYRKRRRALMDRLGGMAALVIQELKYQGDRTGADFYYLTGIDEPGAGLLLAPSAKPYKELLFLANHNDEFERWSGERAILPSKDLEVATGIARIARERSMASDTLHACLESGLAYIGDYTSPNVDNPKALELYNKVRTHTLGCQIKDLHGLLGRMREVKEPEELELMRKAIGYTAAGHAAALKAVHAGTREFEVKDAIEDAFRRAGSRHVAYDTITGSGENGAVLHYPKDDRAMKDGELIVIDAGAEAEYYATDVTRTLPVGGTFTDEQRALYQVVLRAQTAGIAAAHAGVTVGDIDRATRKVVEDAGYYDFYIHQCCHFVGLEVHDAGDYDAPLPAGAVITVEPGIYLPQRGMGVRIEDEILITQTGAELLTKEIPKEPEEIERLMKMKR